MSTTRAPRPSARLDHDWYDFRTLHDPAPLSLPTGKRLAVILTIVVQHYRLDARPPFPLPGSLDRPPPDFGNFTQRQVGQSEGLWRLVEAAGMYGIPVSFVVEAEAVPLIDDVRSVLERPAHCVVAGGAHAVRLHTNAMSENEERTIIVESLRTLQSAYSRQIVGWRSPYCSQSGRTLDLLAACGVRYVCDFANDDRPYALRTAHGPLTAVPMSHFYSDLYLIHQCRQRHDEFVDANLRAVDCLAKEADRRDGACVLPIVLHPWISGTPHRIRAIEELLHTLHRRSDVAFLTADGICNG
jgi:peptidoglycan/xylan/chitin deacetylase (PgdA/CDA1 family)